jgi:purine-binding chemotaxis protein CheW
VPLPAAPPVIEGVVNLRGAVVPILDLRARFSLGARPLHPDDHLVFAEAGPRVVGFRVDRVLDLVPVPEDLIDAARDVTPAAEYLEGFAKLPDGLVLIHDPASFLSRAESSKLDEALGMPAGPDGSR